MAPRRSQQGRNWTFPNARGCGAADPFLCGAGGLVVVSGGGWVGGGVNPYRPRPHSDVWGGGRWAPSHLFPFPPPLQAPVCGPPPRRGASPQRPPSLPPPLSAGSSRTASASDVGDEGGAEGRCRGGGGGCDPPGLQRSESLSDSLYDSLSSCGSQG